MARRKNVKRIDPRYFLHETVNRNDDGSRNEDELEEGFFDAVGNLAARSGAFGEEDQRSEFWRRKGAEAAEGVIDRAATHAKNLHPTAKKKILRQLKKDFIKGNYKSDLGVIRRKAAFAVKQADWAKGDELSAKASARAQEKAQDRKERESAKRREADRKSDAAKRYAADMKRMDKEDEIADMRARYIPAAGSSTNRTRRRNRGELEEGWDDVKDAAGKAWKKVKGGAEDAWDTVATTASDIKHSPGDLGAKFRRKRKAKAAEKRAEYEAHRTEYDAENARREKEEKMARAGREKEKAFKAKHGMSREDYEAKRRRDAKKANRDYIRQTPDEKRRARRARDAKEKSRLADKEQEVLGYKDKRYSNTVGRGFEE